MKTYMVGGAVRDHMMGLVPKDFDYVVVGATPEQLVEAGYQKVGADFPVFLAEDGTEFAMARTERKTGHGYNGFDTRFTPDVTLSDDLFRRDLTVNAMAFDKEGYERGEFAVIDPYHGMDDLEDKVFRHVSEAFAEDPLRVLRLARFAARFGPEWTIHPSTLELCRSLSKSGELKHLTKERIVKELTRALAEPFAAEFFTSLREMGAMSVFPGLEDAEHILYFQHPTNPLMNWALATSDMLTAEIESLERHLNMPNEYREFTKMFHSLFDIFDEEGRSKNVVDLLYSADAYRKSELFLSMLESCREAGIFVVPFEHAYAATSHVCFDTLPEHVREHAKGKEIAEAIKEQRKFALKKTGL
jgi:tRNA nucleotidyltransferase/poly(A) polymerase